MSRRGYRLLAAGLVAAEAALLAWNAWRFDWLRGYDALANDFYANVVSGEYRLPSEEESGVWHSPPLWFGLAGLLRRLASEGGWAPIQRPGQLLAAGAGLAICLLVPLLARELWPERRLLPLVAFVLAATSPALVRAAAMYHPETLAVALATGGVLYALRLLRRGPTLVSAVGAGGLLGLAGLTRASALPVLGAVLLLVVVDAGRRRSWRAALALGVTAAVLVAPWLANQQWAHGDALAFNRDPPATPFLERRPASFYLGHRFLRVFDHPVTPLLRNELVPQLYADWWGDWGLTWATPPPPAPGQLLPADVVAVRARQAVVGIVPTVAALAGLLALGLLALRRRSLALGVLPLSALAVGAAYVLFAIRFPSTDGDTIKGTYLLMVLPGGAIGAAFVVDALRPRGRGWTVAIGVVLALLVAIQAPFLIL